MQRQPADPDIAPDQSVVSKERIKNVEVKEGKNTWNKKIKTIMESLETSIKIRWVHGRIYLV